MAALALEFDKLQAPWPERCPLLLDFAPLTFSPLVDAFADDCGAEILAFELPVYRLAAEAASEDAAADLFVIAGEYRKAEIAATGDDGAAAIAAVFDSNVWRGLIARGSASQGRAAGTTAAGAASWRHAAALAVGGRGIAGQAIHLAAASVQRWAYAAPLAGASSASHRRAGGIAREGAQGWRYPPSIYKAYAAAHERSRGIAAGGAQGWRYPPALWSSGRAEWRGVLGFAIGGVSIAGHARGIVISGLARWITPAGLSRLARHIFAPPPIGAPRSAQPRGPLRLEFDLLAPLRFAMPLRLDFLGAHGFHSLDGSFVVDNDIQIYRTSDHAALDPVSLGFERDISQWGYSINMSCAGDEQIALVSPASGPVEIVVSVNGQAFRFFLHARSGSARFADRSATIAGQSPAIALSSAIHPARDWSNPVAMSAAQVCDAELDGSGWAMEYGADIAALMAIDWVLPPRGVSYQRRAPLDSIGALATALGAQLTADRMAAILRLSPAYPGKPWDWGFGDAAIDIPADLAVVVGEEFMGGPGYDKAEAIGAWGGAHTIAVRQGKAGDNPAPAVSDPLITHNFVGYHRCLFELAKGGKWKTSTLRLPVVAGVGIPEPGTLARYGSDIGIVESVRVSVAFPEVWQDIKLKAWRG